MVYIYLLIDSRNNKPFYVGSCSGLPFYRLQSHINNARNNYITKKTFDCTKKKHNLINEIIESGNNILAVTVMECTENDALFFEKLFHDLLTQGKQVLFQSKGHFIRNIKP